jgi:methylenetetrahydrofolate dehydrogenase (NADP+)/methenyltetrahydrofolate cyclohydrolase
LAAEIIDGKRIAEEIKREVVAAVRDLQSRYGIVPGLGAVIVGDYPASQVYVNMKRKACDEVGMFSQTTKLQANATREDVLATIDRLNADARIHGILVQLPIPEHLDEFEVVKQISPEKDIDGLHPENVARLAHGRDGFIPCTPYGVREMLVRSGVKISGARAVVVGRSNLVGRPMAQLLLQKGARGDATVCVCHSRTRDLAAVCREADILIVAMGRPKFVTADMVKPGAVVVDVGINRVEDPTHPKGYRLVGDVDFQKVKEVAGSITPVPGGVGPMTIAMLLKNTLLAAQCVLGKDPTAP